jgi:hypothetical protein
VRQVHNPSVEWSQEEVDFHLLVRLSDNVVSGHAWNQPFASTRAGNPVAEALYGQRE